MVHYVRFLKPPRVTGGGPRLTVTALITVTTDLGDMFLYNDTTILSDLVVADDFTYIKHHQEVQWLKGLREVSLTATVAPSHGRDLRLHVYHAEEAAGQIPMILDAWSAPFLLATGSRAASVVERRISIPSMPHLRIWEETGNSIARHIWDAALGCLIYIRDALHKNDHTQGLSQILQTVVGKKIKILELGAGCGIVGIAFAQCLPDCEVELTDQPEAQELLLRNLSQAKPGQNTCITHRTLNWEYEQDVSNFDEKHGLRLVVVSDCTYNADSSPDLVRTLMRISSSSPSTKVLVAMKRRHDSEHVFFDLMEKTNLRCREKMVIELPCAESVSNDRDTRIELYLFACEESSKIP